MDLSNNLKNRYCPKLFTFFEVSWNGDCWLCCPAWLPNKIGNILTQSFDEIWNGDTAKELRNQVFTGNWNYCQHEVCPQIVQNQLPDLSEAVANSPVKKQQTHVETLPTIINFSEDESCNLQCPSCRLYKKMWKKGTPQYNSRKRINDNVQDIFFKTPTDRYFEINVTGSGDPFGSIIYREMLQSIDGRKFPNLKVNLNTNAVIFTPKNWHKIYKIHNNLQNCRISFDAGTKHTYETKTRIGGNWDILLENCRFLNERSKEFENFNLHFDFVVQYDNYHEMKDFVKLILDNFDNAHSIHFSKIIDWKTWSSDKYNSKAVWKETHPNHHDFLEHLADDILNHKLVFLGNLYQYRK